MAEIEVVILDTTVRIARGTNSEQVTTLDRSRKGQERLTFKPSAYGIDIVDGDGQFALVPWSQVRQVFYAAEKKK